MLKNFLKSIFLIAKVRNRFNPAVQIGQVQLMQHYQAMAIRKELPAICTTGFRVFSQFEEDGILLYIFSVIGMTHKTFIEIGSNDGVNSNSANLYFNFGFHGLFVDGDPESIKRGQRFFSKYPHAWFYKPKFTCAKVTAENVNDIITKSGYNGTIGLLSIDIDGNDYWVWQTIEVVQPQVVIIEICVEFGLNNIVVPYNPEYEYPGKHPVYHGASPAAMVCLAKRKGYRLVAANDLGINFIFVKNGIADDLLHEVSAESLLNHPAVQDSYQQFEPIKDWEYLKG